MEEMTEMELRKNNQECPSPYSGGAEERNNQPSSASTSFVVSSSSFIARTNPHTMKPEEMSTKLHMAIRKGVSNANPTNICPTITTGMVIRMRPTLMVTEAIKKVNLYGCGLVSTDAMTQLHMI